MSGSTVGSMQTSIRSDGAPVRVRRLGSVDYRAAWELQRELADARAAGGPDSLLLLEHPPTYTAGRRTLPEERPQDGTPVIDTDRGGKITWHGPGQLVGYPIIGLAEPLDVVNFVRRLEEALITVCADLGLATGRVEGRSGVWVPPDERGPARKIAAIGIRVARATTLHGFALNCDCDLGAFGSIVPCGIADAGVTSLTAELGRRIGVDDIADRVADAVSDWSGGTRIGHCLHQFHRDWSRRVLAQGAVVLFISDGLDREEDSGLDREIERLHKSCRRLIWLNPMLRFEGYEPRAMGNRAIMPYVDDFRPIHNLNSLAALVDVLSGPAANAAAMAEWRKAAAGRRERMPLQ